MIGRSSPILAILFCCAAGSAALQLHAQQVDDAADLRTRFATLSDTAALALIERKRARTGTVPDLLDAGFAALRLWEITGNPRHASRARRHFDRAADRDPSSAWAHYGHALTWEAEMKRHDGIIVVDDVLGRSLGFDPASRARRAAERAVALDPALPGVTELLAELAFHTRDGEAMTQARDSYTRAADDGRDTDEMLLSLARLSRRTGDYAGSLAAAERLIRRAGPHTGEARLAAARALASIDGREDDAAAEYADALMHASVALLDSMWRDADLIATERDHKLWANARDAEAKREVLLRFWEMRGALGDMDAAERAVEHYRRVNHAYTAYPRHGQYGAAPASALRLLPIHPELDDAGVMYVRHGEPLHEFVSPGGDYMIWYRDDHRGERVSHHFRRFGGQAGFSRDHILLRFVSCPLDPEAAMYDRRLWSITGYRGCRMVREVSANVRDDSERALVTESHVGPIDRAIPFHYEWYAFRGGDGRTDVVATFGVPAENLAAEPRSMRVSFTVADTAGGRIWRNRLDTDPQLRGSPGEVVRTHLALSALPVRGAAYRIGVREDDNPRIGTSYGGRIDVPDFSGDTLMMSDVVLAQPDGRGSFARGETTLALMPARLLTGGRFRVFYELYNLPGGTVYTTELSIERADRGIVSRLLRRGEDVRLRFQDVAPDNTGTLQELRDITVPFDEGEYMLTVTVTADGREIRRERRLVVQPPAPQ